MENTRYYERTPSGLENSKTLKHKTKPTFKTYPFHLMFIVYMSFTSQPRKDASKEFFIERGRNYELHRSWTVLAYVSRRGWGIPQ